MQIIASRMPFHICIPSRRPAPHLTYNTGSSSVHQTLFAPSLAAQQPRNHLTSLCLNLLHGTPFALRSARLSPPFCSLCYLKSPVRLSIHYRRIISTEHRALQTLPNNVRGGHSAHPSSGPPISWWTSRATLPSKSHTCLHPSLHPALKTSCPQTSTHHDPQAVSNPCTLEFNFRLDGGRVGDGSAAMGDASDGGRPRLDPFICTPRSCRQGHFLHVSELNATRALLSFVCVSTRLNNNTTASSDRRVTNL
ncbi:hypothetical protein Q7P35_009399 [Cladosporium inversicolor]